MVKNMKKYDFLKDAIEASKRNKVNNVIILNNVVIYECDEVIKILTNDKIIYKYGGLTLTLNRDMTERDTLMNTLQNKEGKDD